MYTKHGYTFWLYLDFDNISVSKTKVLYSHITKHMVGHENSLVCILSGGNIIVKCIVQHAQYKINVSIMY